MDNNYFQKYLPVILIAISVIFGGYLMFKKGLISLPGNKGKVVNIGKDSVVDLMFTEDEYKLSYAEMDSAILVDIAKFDKNEQWQGNGSIEENLITGGMMMSLIDRDSEKASSYLLKNMNLSSVDNLKFTINLKTDPDNIESFSILFGNKDGTKYYRFPVSNLNKDMNYLSISKFRFSLGGDQESKSQETKVTAGSTAAPVNSLTWDKIERVQLELISRPGTKSSLDVGWIRGEKENIFDSDWNWDGSSHFLNLYHNPEGKIALLVQNTGRSIGTLRKVRSVKDFNYSAKILSIKQGPIGLFFRGDYKTAYGYYLVVGGLGTSDWSISKYYLDQAQLNTKVILKGQIGNFEFSKNQPYWLKVSVKGNSIIGYFSLNGKDFTKLGEVKDTEFGSGGIGLAVSNGGIGYFDEFKFTQK